MEGRGEESLGGTLSLILHSRVRRAAHNLTEPARGDALSVRRAVHTRVEGRRRHREGGSHDPGKWGDAVSEGTTALKRAVLQGAVEAPCRRPAGAGSHIGSGRLCSLDEEPVLTADSRGEINWLRCFPYEPGVAFLYLHEVLAMQ